MIITEKYFENIGWVGFILIVSAYLLITTGFLDVNSTAYHLTNLAGALCMAINARHKQARPLFWLNVVWSMIAVIGLIQIKLMPYFHG